MHKSEVVARHAPAPAQHYLQYPDHGTRVTVRDLFGGMPVRVKQRAIVAEKQRGNHKDWEELRRSIVALLLCWHGDVTVTIRETGTLQKLTFRPSSRSHNSTSLDVVDVPRVCAILSQAAFITPPERSSWVQTSAAVEKLGICGTISLEPSANKYVQFLSFGIQPITSLDGQSILHDEINRLFLNSAFGNEEEAEDLIEAERIRRANDARFKSDGYTNKELKSGKKGVDRWPMFFINIQQKRASTRHENMDVDDVLDYKGNSLNMIIELLRAMILEFLTRHHFRPKASRRLHLRQNSQETGMTSHETVDRSKRTIHDLAESSKIPRPRSAPNLSSGKTPADANKQYSTTFDSLGGNVKLPSFRRSSSRTESPFDGWSKIKRGTSAPKLKSSNLGFTHRPEITSSSITRNSFKLGSPEKLAKPLLSKTGEIIRRPFEDIAPLTRPKTLRLTRPEDQPDVQNCENDELDQWINPVTKVKSLVNKRTGLTIIANRFRASNDSSQPSTLNQGHFYSRQNILRCSAPSSETPSSWIGSILKNWQNPVFSPTEPTIPQVAIEGVDTATQNILHGRQHHCSQIDIDRAFKESSAGISGRISKDALRTAEVISQVDKKFILVKLRVLNTGDSGMLVLVDQHAADERIRIEALMEELCTPSPADNSSCTAQSSILTAQLDKPLTFEISTKEIKLLGTYRTRFANWGILYDLPAHSSSDNTQRLHIRSLPPGIIERCKIDPRPLIELIRTEAWKCSETPPQASSQTHPDQSWLHRIHQLHCPQGLLDMLNSRACRSAIMFNDELSLEQCELLVRRLAKCVFPFQCAHGRPSLVPLADVGVLKMGEGLGREAKGKSFGKAFGGWSREKRDQTL